MSGHPRAAVPPPKASPPERGSPPVRQPPPRALPPRGPVAPIHPSARGLPVSEVLPLYSRDRDRRLLLCSERPRLFSAQVHVGGRGLGPVDLLRSGHGRLRDGVVLLQCLGDQVLPLDGGQVLHLRARVVGRGGRREGVEQSGHEDEADRVGDASADRAGAGGGVTARDHSSPPVLHRSGGGRSQGQGEVESVVSSGCWRTRPRTPRTVHGR